MRRPEYFMDFEALQKFLMTDFQIGISEAQALANLKVYGENQIQSKKVCLMHNIEIIHIYVFLTV